MNAGYEAVSALRLLFFVPFVLFVDSAFQFTAAKNSIINARLIG